MAQLLNNYKELDMYSSTEILAIRAALADNYALYAQGLDSKNWPMVRACFADEFYIDYGDISAPSGDPAIPRQVDAWLQVLQGVINGFDVTRHTITNHRFVVSDEEVSCRAYLIADHIVFPAPDLPLPGPEDIVTVVGEYYNHYSLIEGDWKIVKSGLEVHWSSGNLALFETAGERAANYQG